VHVQEEIDGMARGAGVPVDRVATLLYADIAPRAAGKRGGEESPIGPMCSALMGSLADGETWVGRNCDWLTPTLMRGTAAVWHARPNKIPVLAVGIRGDIDVDTGLNAERLWLHLHTMFDPKPVTDDRPRISWLFWAREALETCATLDELEGFIEATRRDRGVMAIAVEGRTGSAAVFECGTGSHLRRDFDPSAVLCATNHRLDKVSGPTPNRSGTLSRLHALRDAASRQRPQRGPDDLVGLLGGDGVEMRDPEWIRTIYSAVASPAMDAVWFSAGTPCGVTAASGGAWECVPVPWARGG
jgi:hypothetical protein